MLPLSPVPPYLPPAPLNLSPSPSYLSPFPSTLPDASPFLFPSPTYLPTTSTTFRLPLHTCSFPLSTYLLFFLPVLCSFLLLLVYFVLRSLAHVHSVIKLSGLLGSVYFSTSTVARAFPLSFFTSTSAPPFNLFSSWLLSHLYHLLLRAYRVI